MVTDYSYCYSIRCYSVTLTPSFDGNHIRPCSLPTVISPTTRSRSRSTHWPIPSDIGNPSQSIITARWLDIPLLWYWCYCCRCWPHFIVIVIKWHPGDDITSPSVIDWRYSVTSIRPFPTDDVDDRARALTDTIPVTAGDPWRWYSARYCWSTRYPFPISRDRSRRPKFRYDHCSDLHPIDDLILKADVPVIFIRLTFDRSYIRYGIVDVVLVIPFDIDCYSIHCCYSAVEHLYPDHYCWSLVLLLLVIQKYSFSIQYYSLMLFIVLTVFWCWSI